MDNLEAADKKREADSAGPGGGRFRISLWAMGLFPLVILAAIVYLFLVKGSAIMGTPPVPADALLKLEFERVILTPNRIVAYVRNTGPTEATVGQVLVNEAIWDFTIAPSARISRLGSATISIAYPWLAAEPIILTLITSNGMTFTRTIEVSAVTPGFSWRTVGSFSLLGVYAGVIPVFLGLLWFPFLRRIGDRWLGFLIAVTVGILIFLGVDVLVEGFEAAGRVPAVFRGVIVLTAGLLIGVFGLMAGGHWATQIGAGGRKESRRLTLAYMVAVGIGLHNLGEGLAIGAAYTTGEVALGELLVIGFTIHNSTEGFGILGPVARQSVPLSHILWFGLIAGGPTVIGTLVGGFANYDILVTFFFALGAGAIFYVVYELGKLFLAPEAKGGNYPVGIAGVLIGLAVMFLTALLVTTS